MTNLTLPTCSRSTATSFVVLVRVAVSQHMVRFGSSIALTPTLPQQVSLIASHTTKLFGREESEVNDWAPSTEPRGSYRQTIYIYIHISLTHTTQLDEQARRREEACELGSYGLLAHTIRG